VTVEDQGSPDPPEGFALAAVLRGHEGAIYDLAWSPDGELLATASQDSTGRIWRAADGALVHVLDGRGGSSTMGWRSRPTAGPLR